MTINKSYYFITYNNRLIISPFYLIVLLSYILIINVALSLAGASSAPKNLVNLYTHSPNSDSSINNNININNNSTTPTTNTNSNNLNEYQYRLGASKSVNNDRYKSLPTIVTRSNPNESDDYNQPQNDFGSAGISEYPNHDDRGQSSNVPDCKSRLKLTGTRGFITDGYGFYTANLQCVWLIDSGRDNATIRIQFRQFNIECNYDYLYIFDGDSIYSPLVASLSGDMKDFSSAFMMMDNGIGRQNLQQQQQQSETSMISSITSNNNDKTVSNSSSMSSNKTNGSIINDDAIIPFGSNSPIDKGPFEIRTYSGKAFIYFHSDTAETMSGFLLTYTIDSCPLDCSNRGECDYFKLKCKCNPGYFGDGCQYVLCPNNCTSPENGVCDENKSCICNRGFHGLDCSLRSDQQTWISAPIKQPENFSIPSRAFHQATVVDGIMYIIGGRTQSLSNVNMGIFRKKSTPILYSFDIKKRKWTDLRLFGTTGLDHLAELTGHSVAAKGSKIFIYGGMAMNNTVLNSLTVFDTKSNSLTTLFSGNNEKQGERDYEDNEISSPIAVVGHSANIIDSHMYIFSGFNPIYGYVNLVQKFNLANNSWSLVKRKGGSVKGSIGHTTTYDSLKNLIYLYGGHNAFISNKLYSFDPNTEVWTFLQPGPSFKYYHQSLIVDRKLIVLGGNSYNSSHSSDQCFQQTYLTYDLSCSKSNSDGDGNEFLNATDDGNVTKTSTFGSNQTINCERKCWQTISDFEPSVLKRHGHSVVQFENELILFGGFNGILMNDIKFLNISTCSAYKHRTECLRAKLALNCQWNLSESQCENQNEIASKFNPSAQDDMESSMIDSANLLNNCTQNELKYLQNVCESRGTCDDCVNTNLGCVWCDYSSKCSHSNCKSSQNNGKVLTKPGQCFEEFARELHQSPYKEKTYEIVIDCKNIENCHLCHSTNHCSWKALGCSYNLPVNSLSPGFDDILQEMTHSNASLAIRRFASALLPMGSTNNSMVEYARRSEPSQRSLFTSLGTGYIANMPIMCDSPCFMRKSCNECTSSKCIWCSTTEQCLDSSAYFAYHAMGQCMHYVAHMLKCPAASCAGIEGCDKCLANPRCGWLNDISNTGRGRCIEGTSSGPSFEFNSSLTSNDFNVRGNINLIGGSNQTTTSLATLQVQSILSNWFYSGCPSCQCNGHSYCRSTNSSICMQPCQDFTEGQHCERCIHGYFGDPINGGSCKPCECNGHAQTCHRETGKCYCSTKGITGHNCNRCDDQNNYIGDLTSNENGTCYYNLTTDYQYTFNMSKLEDHFYSDINFINVPLKKDSDLDFTIACSKLALVNITSGTSFKNRKLIHSSLECGSFRLRFPHDRHISNDANYSLFVHVYKFQTPLVLQIAFSQHRTFYLPQFFFTFSRLRYEYDDYMRRQRQFIEMEQMASRPFSTVLLEMFRSNPKQNKPDSDQTVTSSLLPEPTPVSFEPCFGNNIGVMSVFVQLPGRPNLAIGSALVTLNDESTNGCDDVNSNKQIEKEQQVSV